MYSWRGSVDPWIAWAFKYQSHFQFRSNIYEYTWNKNTLLYGNFHIINY